jgi:hypothetical protein
VAFGGWLTNGCNMTYSEQLQPTGSKIRTVWLYALLFFAVGGTIAVSISHSALLLLPVGGVCVLAGIIGTLMVKLDATPPSLPPDAALSDATVQARAFLEAAIQLAATARRERDRRLHGLPTEAPAPQVTEPAFYPAGPRVEPESTDPRGPRR